MYNLYKSIETPFTVYSDDMLTIKFSQFPEVKVRCILCYMNEDMIRDLRKKPFICENSIVVTITDKRTIPYSDDHEFTIPKGYTWDGATIPRTFWRLIGSKTDPEFLVPSMIHDYLCENHEAIDNDRYLADRVFEKLLQVSGVNAFKRWLIFHSVDNFQKLCGWRR